MLNDRMAGWARAACAVIAFAGLPAAIAWFDSGRVAVPHGQASSDMRETIRPPSPPPPVEPLRVRAVAPDDARKFNARVPFSRLPNPAARPFLFDGEPDDLDRAVDCLAAAQLYEAGDDTGGQKAVAQVVLNRVRHPAFPKSVCGVVFQGAERRTGCQFTFTCDGALARTPSASAWARARDVARLALSGSVDRRVGYATHYHTDWVVPYWSSSLDKVAAVDTHLFFRWTGWWGTPPAFLRRLSSREPVVPQIARLSAAHQGAAVAVAGAPGMPLGLTAPAALAAAPAKAISADMLGKQVDGARLIAIAPEANAFILLLDPLATDSYPGIATRFCAGRQRCRILAWSDRTAAPRGFPIPESTLASMAFSYIHDAPSGLQRALWNCARTPRTSRSECMRVREPAAAGAAPAVVPTVKAKAAETVVIRPVEARTAGQE
ncbi:cell wall hydrolase [Sphingobium algorifonticola]|uniref:Cell wall hydrolase n=1 Tax=Sphingobium algorifonticola TaxID=2008318 RepID=A0A437J561_9SPHN|nr:cell wall hydrolase [Sphingobium algorifonticola]RVT39805.1 cell wall hydrolase [Sphingobium algorifonticola]